MKNKTGIKKNTPKAFGDGRTKLNLMSKFKNWGKNFTHPAKLLVVDMQLNNGDTELFVVEVEKDSFKLFNKRYIVNPEYNIYNRTLKMHTCKYHEGLSLPIKQYVNVNKIKSEIVKYTGKNPKQADVISNLDPAVLESLVSSTIIQKVFQGAELQDVFNLVKLLSIIILLVSGISLVLNISMSGVF